MDLVRWALSGEMPKGGVFIGYGDVFCKVIGGMKYCLGGERRRDLGVGYG